MKKIKVLFSALAFIIAVGGAFASKFDTAVTAYKFIPASGGNPAQCEQTGTCDGGSFDCTSGSVVLKDSSNPTISCGADLKRSTL